MKVSGIPQDRKQITMKTTTQSKKAEKVIKWWKSPSSEARGKDMLTTAAFLKDTQGSRVDQAAVFARLYGNVSLYNYIGNGISNSYQYKGLPADRPTFNIIQSATDTLVSRITQSRPSPTFLTDNADYKERNLAKKLNNFILGEFYQTKLYEKTAIMLRDALVEGTGCLKVYETDCKVCVERVLLTDLLIDPSESIYGEPRQLFQVKLMDRDVLMELAPDMKSKIARAEMAYPDNSADSSKTISDLVMVVEAWHLPSGKDAKDGRHIIACTGGTILDEEYDKDKFPFAFLHYSNRLLGFWAQGLAEQLMGTQIEINSLLHTITKAIKLVGVPRIFQEAGSKVTKASHNNDIGTIVTYQGVKPTYEVAQCVPQELYAQLQRLIDYGYQQCGVSMLSASSQKPAGLNSGEAIRSYDDISTDRFAAIAKKYDNTFIDLAYLITDLARDIAEREGKYQTVFPDKNGTKQIDLPKMSILKNPFVIQCFNMSSLPRDPAGRLQKVTEMIQAGMITLKEGRRLLSFPDLQQTEILANAAEERILQVLDKIVEGNEDEDGKVINEDEDGNPEDPYTPPDPFMDLPLALELTTQYINLYSQFNLEEEKMAMLRQFFSQVQDIVSASQPPMMGPPGMSPPGAPAPGGSPQALPEPLPTSPLIPNAPGAA